MVGKGLEIARESTLDVQAARVARFIEDSDVGPAKA